MDAPAEVDSTALIQDAAAVLGILAGILGFVFWGSTRPEDFRKHFHGIVPAPLVGYVILSTLVLLALPGHVLGTYCPNPVGQLLHRMAQAPVAQAGAERSEAQFDDAASSWACQSSLQEPLRHSPVDGGVRSSRGGNWMW